MRRVHAPRVTVFPGARNGSRSIRDVGMAGWDPVPAGVEYQRLPVTVLVLFHLPKEDDVIAAIVLANVTTDELGDCAAEQGHACRALIALHAGKLVRQRSGELPRQMV